jgi:hypothetical protein
MDSVAAARMEEITMRKSIPRLSLHPDVGNAPTAGFGMMPDASQCLQLGGIETFGFAVQLGGAEQQSSAQLALLSCPVAQ